MEHWSPKVVRTVFGGLAWQRVWIQLRLWSLQVRWCTFSTFRPRRGAADLVEGGQRPVIAASPFCILAVLDLLGINGRVSVRKVEGCNR